MSEGKVGMGIVSYGIIEGWVEQTDWSREHWEVFVDEIHFNKDYLLRNALRESGATEGWPKDVGVVDWQREERCIEQGLMWATLPQVEKAVKHMEDEAKAPDEHGYPPGPSPQVYATLAFMKAFSDRTKREVRLLMYES